MSSRSLPWFSLCRFANGWVLAALALLCFLAPVATTMNDLRDPALRSAAIPQAAWRLHRSLTPRYEAWARQRLATSRAAALSLTNISGTEWPLFGSVFYLWSTEALQAAWERDAKLCPTAPKVYARTAIDAALHLVIDPSQAAWVKTHWGSNYLKTENVFYRMLVMAALVTHARLTDDKQYLPMLRDQVESFAAELDASPHGLLDDYPGECYPVDVLAALAMIHEADSVLGTDHSAFLQRARRGFAPKYLDEQGLIPYRVDSKTGRIMISSRGCGNSDVPIVGALLWPDLAKDWYAGYVKHFWQEVFMGAGFRELPMGTEIPDGYLNVDSGPVLRGYGFAASAFGVGAARAQAHFEHAYPMSTELLAFSYPLLDGTLYLPRKCSDATDAPYLGEAGILYSLTRTPAKDAVLSYGGRMPSLVWIALGIPTVIGLALMYWAWRSWRLAWRYRGGEATRARGGEVILWGVLAVAMAGLWWFGHPWLSLIPLAYMVFLPSPAARL